MPFFLGKCPFSRKVPFFLETAHFGEKKVKLCLFMLRKCPVSWTNLLKMPFRFRNAFFLWKMPFFSESALLFQKSSWKVPLLREVCLLFLLSFFSSFPLFLPFFLFLKRAFYASSSPLVAAPGPDYAPGLQPKKFETLRPFDIIRVIHWIVWATMWHQYNFIPDGSLLL